MFFILLKKELYNEFRSRELILSMLVFGLSIILAYAFTSDVSRVIVANYAPGMFWAMILFVTVLGVHRSFSYEKEMDAFSMLITAPIDRGLIYLSKWIEFLYDADQVKYARLTPDLETMSTDKKKVESLIEQL